MAEVILKNVSKVYRTEESGVHAIAVDALSLHVRDKEFMVIVGPSGCGKSTLLRMVAGLEEISSGDLYIGDQRCNDVQPKDRDIAMVFQNYALYPHMTVEENMAFGLKLRKIDSREISRRVGEAADILGLQPYLNRRPKALSGGQRQRVALGRAIVRKPKAFLFDEPLSNLDAKMRTHMRVEIATLAARLQTTVLYVTHDQTEAMTLGERIACLHDGKLQQAGTPLELYRNPANLFVAGFIGTPQMNLLACRVDAGDVVLDGRERMGLSPTLRGLLPSSPHLVQTVGIRPESFSLCTPGESGLPVVVELVEHLGAENLVHGTIGSRRIVANLGTEFVPNRGAMIHLKLRDRGVHFFTERKSEETDAVGH